MAFDSNTVSFERFMLADDRDEYPMAFWLTTEFSGNFQQAVFEQALLKALGRHPLLRSRIEGARLSQSRWIESVESMPFVDFGLKGVPKRYPAGQGARIDLRRENGLRIWVRTSENGISMSFQFHHACCDALGAMQFLEDLFTGYDHYAHARVGSPPLKALSQSLHSTRADFGLSWPEKFWRFPIDVVGVLVGLGVFFCIRPVPIAASQTVSKGDVGPSDKCPELITHTFDESIFTKLQQVARLQKVTLNDIAISDLFCVLRAWNERQKAGSGSPVLRIMVPMSLREANLEQMPAMNYVGMVHLDRRGSRMKSARTLLEGVSWEMRFLKLLRLGISFSRCWKFLAMVPGGQRMMIPLGRCCATTVLSNFGRAFEGCALQRRNGRIVLGDMVLQSITGAPPIRPWVRATFTLTSYAERLTLAMHYDRTCLTRADAVAILQSYAKRFVANVDTILPLEEAFQSTVHTPTLSPT